MALPYFFAARARPFWISAQSRSDVPAERVAQAHGAVGEAVDFFEADGLAVPEAGHYAATFSAEINGEIDAVWHEVG